MKLKQSVQLLLIALFVWTSQSTTIHFQHHIIDEMSECNLCHASEQLDLFQHNSPVVIVNENLAVKTRNHVEKVVVKPRFDYMDVPLFKRVDILENRQYTVEQVPLGFNATAPPYLIS